jgi:hypothetical protein
MYKKKNGLAMVSENPDKIYIIEIKIVSSCWVAGERKRAGAKK